MFESIQHCSSSDEATIALYCDGEVSGSASFSSDALATRVMSCIGPIDAMRECVASHRPGVARCRARVSDEVYVYA